MKTEVEVGEGYRIVKEDELWEMMAKHEQMKRLVDQLERVVSLGRQYIGEKNEEE